MTVTYMTIQIPFSTGRPSAGRTGIFWNFHLYFHSPIRDGVYDSESLIVSFYRNSIMYQLAGYYAIQIQTKPNEKRKLEKN